MNPGQNPFEPGAGSQPPELAGRDDLIRRVTIAIERQRNGRTMRGVVLVGLRGVGKTVLLRRMGKEAERMEALAVDIEAPEDRSLPALLIPRLKKTLYQLSAAEAARDAAERGLRVLLGFSRALKLKYADIEVSLEGQTEPGTADNGDLEQDLQEVFLAVGAAAAAAGRCVVLLIDELQYVKKKELSALLMALHRTTQESLPVLFLGAGLPQLRQKVANAKSYAERLVEFPGIGQLCAQDARTALQKPAQQQGHAFTEAALDRILRETDRYPYFLQEWGKQTWDVAAASPFQAGDVDRATELALLSLDESFFQVRFDRMTPKEKDYVRTMADLGPGPHRSGEIAAAMNREVQNVGGTRDTLIRKGLIWSPEHGQTAFTVPLFDRYLKRKLRP